MTAMTDERVAVRYSELGPHRIAYSCAGDSGDPVLLVMGLTMRGDAWRHQIDDLAQHHRVAWFDHAGLGASGPVRSRRLRMADLAADAIGVLDSLGWERAHLVGLSMGGMIAQHIALDVPGRIATLSLLATHSGGCQPVLPPREAIKLLLASTVARDSERRLEVLAKLGLASPVQLVVLGYEELSDRAWRTWLVVLRRLPGVDALVSDAALKIKYTGFELPPARKAGIKPILGMEAYVAPGDRRDRTLVIGPEPSERPASG